MAATALQLLTVTLRPGSAKQSSEADEIKGNVAIILKNIPKFCFAAIRSGVTSFCDSSEVFHPYPCSRL